MAKASRHRLIPVILGCLAWDGRGIVRPLFPTCSLGWELALTWCRSRGEKGRSLARFAYSPFVMAVMQCWRDG